jgi:predicted DNA-binding protein (MmcQ/YjbR family)
MTPEAFDAFCGSLPATHRVIQWENAHVWKVGPKMFAVGSFWGEPGFKIIFKCTPMSFEILGEQPGLRPAPYMASRGLKWIQWIDARSVSEEDLKAYLRNSYDMVAEKLPKAERVRLGLPLLKPRARPTL